MAVAQTKAASFIQEHTEEISSHQIISLLMDGALERVGQAVQAHIKNQRTDFDLLAQKLVAIINGLRNSLNMGAGDIATNLDALYEYMIDKITRTPHADLIDALLEVRSLILEIKQGWDHMSYQLPEVPESIA
jgi:flagellar secretion chaperone FliS